MPLAFITGAGGFIGGYTVREFVQRGWHVIALIHRKTSPELEELTRSGEVTILRGNLDAFADLDAGLRRAVDSKGVPLDAVVHCAGRASDVGRREEFRRANLESVRNLGQLAMEMGARRFVFVSTTDVYGLRDFNAETEDQLPLANNTGNPYPEFKIRAERWITETLPPDRYSIIRPAAVWGVGDPTLTPRVVSFLRSSPWIVHFGKWRGRNRWPLAHVRNVSSAIFLAATLDQAAGSPINVLDSEVTSMDEFYRAVASVYLPDKKFRRLVLPMWLGKAFGAVVSGVSNTLNLDHPFTDPSRYALSSVSCNLDFSNAAMLRLFEAAGIVPVTRDEGVRELQASQGHM